MLLNKTGFYRVMASHGSRHLYRGKGKTVVRREFKRRYGKKEGDYVYGAVVGKVKRERSHGKRRRR